jgi:hypothetical protein
VDNPDNRINPDKSDFVRHANPVDNPDGQDNTLSIVRVRATGCQILDFETANHAGRWQALEEDLRNEQIEL